LPLLNFRITAGFKHFCFPGNVVRAKVENVSLYSSFEDLFKDINYKQVIPFANSVSEALEEYKKIYGNNLNKNKVIAFKIKTIDYLWGNI